MKNLVFCLEEPSAKELLKIIVPKLIPKCISIFWIVFEGKQDLEKNVVKKIKNWMKPNSYFIVIRDKDAGNCKLIKEQLVTKIKNTNKIDRTLIRIACHELESFYLGDLKAVEKGLNLHNLSHKQVNRKYRVPDKLANASQELEKITGGRYQKVSCSREIAEFMRLDNSNKSHSFNVLINGIQKIIL